MRQCSSAKAVIFDLGNVLLDFDHLIAAERISHFCDKSPREIVSLAVASEATIRFEEGKISPSDYYCRLKEILGFTLEYADFARVWNEIFTFTPENQEVLSLVRQARQRCKTALLSNVNQLHWEYIKKKYSVFASFDQLFASHELGARKPDPRVYRDVLSQLGVSAAEVFYTDDRPDLVEGAKKLGINSCVYASPGQLRADLVKYGVLPD